MKQQTLLVMIAMIIVLLFASSVSAWNSPTHMVIGANRDAALAGRFLANVPHNAIDRCLTGAGQEQHQRTCQ